MIGAIALIAFWTVAIRLWFMEERRTVMIFIGLWAAGLFGFAVLGLSDFIFLSYEAGLAIVLLMVERYHTAF
ncbi:hypothetical protein ACFL54_06830 [Planctomycetota bacterium]